MTGTSVRVKGLKRHFDRRDGCWYCYHRATGERIVEEFGGAAFFERLAALESRRILPLAERAKPGSLRALILAYRDDERFTDLAPRTKEDYEGVFAFLEPLWDKPLVFFTHEQIVILVRKWKKARGRRFVNYCLTVMRLLFSFAKAEVLIKTNPMLEVEGVKRKQGGPQWNRPWTDEERRAFWDATAKPRWLGLRLPFALALFGGLREGDVIRLAKTCAKNGIISHETAKRKVWIDLTIHPLLAQAIAEAPPHDAITLIANSKGRPWKNENSFRQRFFELVRLLEEAGELADGCTFHGLRHSLAHTIAEHKDGFNEHDIAAVLGQSSAKSARAYTVRANRTRRAKAVLAKIQPLRRK